MSEEGELKKRIRNKGTGQTRCHNCGRITFPDVSVSEMFEVVDEAKKDIYSKIPEEDVVGVTVSGDGEEYNVWGYSKEDVNVFVNEIKKWFGDSS